MSTAPAGVQCGLPLSVYAPPRRLACLPLPGGFALALLFAVVVFALLRLPCCLLCDAGRRLSFAPLCGFSGGVRSLSSPCPLVL